MISTLKKLQAKKGVQENNGGFTLIELLIVIVVLGILAAVVVFSLGGVTSTSAVAACKADGATVATAMAAEQAQTPGTAPLLASGAVAGDLAPAYLASIPNNAAHYKFSIVSGVLYVGATTSTSGTEGTVTWTTGTPTGWIAWASAASCDTPSMVK